MKDLFVKSAVYILALFLSLAPAVFPARCEELPIKEKEALSLSLDDTIRTALGNNRDIMIQEQEVDFAKANITAAQSKFFPQASIGYGFTYNDAVATTDSLPNSRKDTRIFYGYKSNNQLKLNGTQMIYDGGASIANLKEARVRLKIQEETLAARRLDIEFEAKRLFYGLLLAYETLHINQYMVDQAQAHYENVRNKFEQGTSSRFDALQSKVQVSKLIPPLVQAQNSIEVISNDLKKLLYLDMGCVIKLKESLRYRPVDVNLEEFLNEAYKNSPEMRLKRLGVDLEKWAIEFAKSGWYPNINAAGNYIYTSDKILEMINPRHDNWNLGISASFSVFDGMSTLAKVQGAKARYSQAILSKENIIEQIAVNIRRGCLDLKEAHAIILSQKESLAEAKDALNISYIGYDNGVMINLDVIDAQVSLSQVEKNLAGGIYDYLLAKAFLDKTMGREYLSFYLKTREVQMIKKNRLIGLVCVLLIIAAAFAAYFIFELTRDHKTIKVSGNIEGNDVRISFRIAGQILNLLADEGSNLKVGQIVARLNTDELTKLQKEAEAQAKAAEFQYQLSKDDYIRNENIYKAGAISAQRRDQYKTTADTDWANVKRSRAQLELANTKLGWADLASPLNGYILVKSAEEGEVVQTGAPVFTAVDLNNIWVTAYINETDVGKVNLNQKATVKIDSFPHKSYSGWVSFISQQAEFTPKYIQTTTERVKLVYRIKVRVDNTSLELKPGMPADAYIN